MSDAVGPGDGDPDTTSVNSGFAGYCRAATRLEGQACKFCLLMRRDAQRSQGLGTALSYSTINLQ